MQTPLYSFSRQQIDLLVVSFFFQAIHVLVFIEEQEELPHGHRHDLLLRESELHGAKIEQPGDIQSLRLSAFGSSSSSASGMDPM